MLLYAPPCCTGLATGGKLGRLGQLFPLPFPVAYRQMRIGERPHLYGTQRLHAAGGVVHVPKSLSCSSTMPSILIAASTDGPYFFFLSVVP